MQITGTRLGMAMGHLERNERRVEVRSTATEEAPQPGAAATQAVAQRRQEQQQLLFDSALTSRQTSELILLERLLGAEGAIERSQEASVAVSELQLEVSSVRFDFSARSAATQGDEQAVAYRASVSELSYEHLALAFSGTIALADGSTRTIDLAFSMERLQVSHRELAFAADGSEVVDPLIIDVAGGGPRLAAATRPFDLDLDGAADALATLAPGGYYLAQDRNGNGSIDDGTELFGPRSGDSYAELAELDHDGNGWVDGAETRRGDLLLWDGADTLIPLDQVGIVALLTEAIRSPFALTDDQGATTGLVRASSLWLGEDETVGTTHHVDLVT